MVGAQQSSDDEDASGASYTTIARHYHQAAVHHYRLGRYEEAQRLAGIALANRAKAHACFLKMGQMAELADDTPEIRRAFAS